MFCHDEQEVSSQSALMRGGAGATIGGHSIGHIAHLGGAAAGVLLVFALSRIPANSPKAA